ncbi:MAG: glycoside hydrolase, partial [Fibrobacter sp.]|nr:glycoside hydrolase [Fibrobacter sp.]
MNMKRLATLGLLAGFGVSALADNPISSYHYLADPSCASDGDTFYILTDVDDYNNQTNWNYDIVGLYAFTSEDMKNWTDH